MSVIIENHDLHKDFAINSEVNALQNDYNTMTERVNAFKQDINNKLQTLSSEHDSSIKNLKNQIKTLKKTSNKLTNDLKTLSKNIDLELKNIDRQFKSSITIQQYHSNKILKLLGLINSIYDYDVDKNQIFKSVITFGTLKIYSNHKFNKFTRWVLKKFLGITIDSTYPIMLFDGCFCGSDEEAVVKLESK